MTFLLFTLSFLYFCKPADPNFRTKPLQNTEYTGFIARNFFQAVVEVPVTKEELPILEERKSCLLEAMRKRDKMVIPILKEIAMENKWNEIERKFEIQNLNETEKEKRQKKESKNIIPDQGPGVGTSSGTGNPTYNTTTQTPAIQPKKEIELENKKNPLLNRGEFAWFINSMFIYKEDYSNPEKCSFVFRNIQDNLFEKVENTKLSFIGEDKKKKIIQPTTETQNQSPSSMPANSGLPQMIR